MGRIRRLFPGGNTCAGFVGFYQELRRGVGHVTLLKGGPGVGKSTLMRKVGRRFEERGEDVTYYRCSGDPDSLDGVYAHGSDYMMLDGTSPHILDPLCPGAADGILNLGACLDAAKLREDRRDIEDIGRDIARRYQSAYRFLAAARQAQADAADTLADALDRREIHSAVNQLFSYLTRAAENGDEKHIFYRAITHRGAIEELDSIRTDRVVAVKAPWGFDADALFMPVARQAKHDGSAHTLYHHPLDAGKTEALAVGGTLFIAADLMDTPVVEIELDRRKLAAARTKLDFDLALHNLCLTQAIDMLSEAKYLHDRLERYYIDAMDYAALDRITNDILDNLPST